MIVIGDVHGRWVDLRERLQAGNVRDEHLVQVGDFGLGFEEPRAEARHLAMLDRYLTQHGCFLWAIHGNHDEPARWAPGAPQPWNAIRLVPDDTIIEVEGKRLLCAGGAISVDRQTRRHGGYWPDEAFILAPERLQRLDLTGLYAVVTHTAPEGVYPYYLGPLVTAYALGDSRLIADVVAERARIGQFRALIDERAEPPFWWYGHFHEHMVEQVGPTRFVLLDMLQCYDPQTGRTW